MLPVDVALRAAPTLKNLNCLYLYIFFHIAKLPNLLGFDHREYASLLSFDKMLQNALIDLKWTS